MTKDTLTPVGTGIRFWMGSGGALLCDCAIPSVTQELSGETAKWYGGRFFVGESITQLAGQTIAKALGGEFIDKQEGA